MWRRGRAWIGIAVIVGLAAAVLSRQLLLRSSDPAAHAEEPEPADAEVTDEPLVKDKRIVPDEEREGLLRRMHVWREPRVPIAEARFAGGNIESLSCKFVIDSMGGTTPKFECELGDGDELRVKYGNGPEVLAETAATRLLRALGFGVDELRLVRTLRCYGCPKEPFSIMKAVELTRTEPLYERIVDYGRYEEFQWVSVERKFDARPVETGTTEGWAFFELERIDEASGGAPRAHVDALRLLAVLLAHWDNKAENQRLVCLDRRWPEGAPCTQPFGVLHDVGATFGPAKLDLDKWEAAPVWEDRRLCTVSMRDLPFEGATFGHATITEAGRQFTARLLSQLSGDQLTELFTEARFGDERGWLTPTWPVAEWVRVFTHKVRAITEGPPCPQP